jgi:metal-sulfur cluster biosynthetic enzyme
MKSHEHLITKAIAKYEKKSGQCKSGKQSCCGKCHGEKAPGEYFEMLNQVLDPELQIGIVDLGLIYKIEIFPKKMVKVTMTLTSPFCPLGPQITNSVKAALKKHKDVAKVEVEMVFEPAWTKEMMNLEVREMLFGNRG